ncbi:MAG: phage holin [Serratia marcescens]|nr:phage holin [Serratia marcescens]
MKLSNEKYDMLKWVAQILLSALAVLYSSLAKTWNLPAGTGITETIVAIDLFLGTLLGLSSTNYYKEK